jgi:dihydrolipoamide dehydrogenase
MESVEGMIKIIAAANDEVIGAHILAPHAGEIIPELTLAIAQKMKLSALSRLIHIHPTISESVAEAALKAKNQALHMLNI